MLLSNQFYLLNLLVDISWSLWYLSIIFSDTYRVYYHLAIILYEVVLFYWLCDILRGGVNNNCRRETYIDLRNWVDSEWDASTINCQYVSSYHLKVKVDILRHYCVAVDDVSCPRTLHFKGANNLYNSVRHILYT